MGGKTVINKNFFFILKIWQMLMAILIGWQIGAQLLRSTEGKPGQARTEILTWSRVSVVTCPDNWKEEHS